MQGEAKQQRLASAHGVACQAAECTGGNREGKKSVQMLSSSMKIFMFGYKARLCLEGEVLKGISGLEQYRTLLRFVSSDVVFSRTFFACSARFCIPRRYWSARMPLIFFSCCRYSFQAVMFSWYRRSCGWLAFGSSFFFLKNVAFTSQP